MKSLHSVLFFLPDQLSETTVYNIAIGILCILLAFSLVALYRRIKYGASLSVLEGMTADTSTSADTTGLDPAVVKLQAQTTALQATYDKLKIAADTQKNRIDANSHALMKTMSDPNQTSNITHVSINPDDPSKTKIPSIDMS
jgi:hypothetical protein